MVLLCEKYNVKQLMVMAFKPKSTGQHGFIPNKEDFHTLANNIKQMRKEFPDLSIEVESCYSPLNAYLKQKFFINTNTGISKGCGAGRDGVVLNVDGDFTPCRHLDTAENFINLKDYWYNSKVLKDLRLIEKTTKSLCKGCRYDQYCLCCPAVEYRLHCGFGKYL